MSVYTKEQVDALLRMLCRRCSESLSELNALCHDHGCDVPHIPKRLEGFTMKRRGCHVKCRLSVSGSGALSASLDFTVVSYRDHCPIDRYLTLPKRDFGSVDSGIADVAGYLCRHPRILASVVRFLESVTSWSNTVRVGVLNHIKHTDEQWCGSRAHHRIVNLLKEAEEFMLVELLLE